MDVLPYLLCLVLLAVIAVVLKRMYGGSDSAAPQGGKPLDGSCRTCSSEPGKCLHDCVVENVVGEIVYFDDEELDEFRGRPSDSYTDDEAALFAEVMYTMRPEEVKDWVASLGRRQVSLPDQIKDEAAMLITG